MFCLNGGGKKFIDEVTSETSVYEVINKLFCQTRDPDVVTIGRKLNLFVVFIRNMAMVTNENHFFLGFLRKSSRHVSIGANRHLPVDITVKCFAAPIKLRHETSGWVDC